MGAIMEQVVGSIELNLNKDIDLRISKYELIDMLNNCTNIALSDIPQGNTRDNLLMELKRLKEIVNNL